MPNCEKPESQKMTHPVYRDLRKPRIQSSYVDINQGFAGPKNVITEF